MRPPPSGPVKRAITLAQESKFLVRLPIAAWMPKANADPQDRPSPDSFSQTSNDEQIVAEAGRADRGRAKDAPRPRVDGRTDPGDHRHHPKAHRGSEGGS